jgi:hypothetical protein
VAHKVDQGSGNNRLDIRRLDDLKEKLVKVIMVALIVAAFTALLIFPVTTILLVSGVSLFLQALSAWLVAGGPGHRRHH